jgi:hypothetical protein
MKLLAKIGMLSLLAGATAGVVYGDPPGGWLSPNGLTAGSTSPAVNGDVDMRAPTGLVDLQVRIQMLRQQTRADARHIQHLQQIARNEKNVIKLNCVNDKLVQVKPQMNIADLNQAEVEAAGDGERGSLFGAVASAAESVRRLREEAEQCIGEMVNFGSESSNSFTGPHVPDDPTRGFGGGGIEPPSYASPFN